MISWLIISILILLGIIAIGLAFYRLKKGIKQETNYKSLFIIGIFWIIVGFIPGNYFFLIMGFVFMVMGLTHKKEWKKHKPWNKLNKAEKQYNKIVTIILGLLVLISLILLLLNL